MIDTHTHLYDTAFGSIAEQADIVGQAVAAGVSRMLLPAVDAGSAGPMRALAERCPEHIRRAMALHPTELGEDWRLSLQAVTEELRLHPAEYIAIGECGLDLYWDTSTLEQQQRVFDAMLALASEMGLPALIHCRQALEPTLEVLRGYPGVSAVFHSFGGSAADVESIRAVGDYYFGINGIVTFKNSELRHTLPAIGPERLLLETDSPYLSPVPYRGRRNDSSHLPVIARTIAQSMGWSPEEAARRTTANALRFLPALE